MLHKFNLSNSLTDYRASALLCCIESSVVSESKIPKCILAPYPFPAMDSYTTINYNNRTNERTMKKRVKIHGQSG